MNALKRNSNESISRTNVVGLISIGLGAAVAVLELYQPMIPPEFYGPAIAAIGALNGLVAKYNALRDRLDELTFFDDVDNTTGILFGGRDTTLRPHVA